MDLDHAATREALDPERRVVPQQRLFHATVTRVPPRQTSGGWTSVCTAPRKARPFAVMSPSCSPCRPTAAHTPAPLATTGTSSTTRGAGGLVPPAHAQWGRNAPPTSGLRLWPASTLPGLPSAVRTAAHADWHHQWWALLSCAQLRAVKFILLGLPWQAFLGVGAPNPPQPPPSQRRRGRRQGKVPFVHSHIV